MTTITELLAGHPATTAAIGAPDRDWLDFAGLHVLSQSVGESLAAAGIGRGDRVAIILPNGPEMAAAFITVAAWATTAPLNAAYRAEELDFYLSDLGAKALIVAENEDGPAVEAARRHGAKVLRLAHDAAGPAGSFRLTAEAGGGTAARA